MKVWLTALVLVLALGGCKERVAGFEHENDPDNLEALWQTIHGRIEAGDENTAAALVKSTLPDREALARALRESVEARVVEKLEAMYRELGSLPAAAIAAGFAPERSRVRVRGATGAEIAAYDDPEVTGAFPAGARRVAAAILRPEVTFYQVELLEPGADKGSKFHLFFWDGERWRTLGPAWRALR